MSEFTPIETQEQFNELFMERVRREKAAISKKYEDYASPDDIKTKEAEFAKRLEESSNALSEERKKTEKLGKDIAEKDAEIKEHKIRSVKTRVAHEMGLSFDAIDFLKGDDEDSIRESASMLSSLIGKNPAPPLADPEAGSEANSDAALRNVIRNINSKGE